MTNTAGLFPSGARSGLRRMTHPSSRAMRARRASAPWYRSRIVLSLVRHDPGHNHPPSDRVVRLQVQGGCAAAGSRAVARESRCAWRAACPRPSRCSTTRTATSTWCRTSTAIPSVPTTTATSPGCRPREDHRAEVDRRRQGRHQAERTQGERDRRRRAVRSPTSPPSQVRRQDRRTARRGRDRGRHVPERRHPGGGRGGRDRQRVRPAGSSPPAPTRCITFDKDGKVTPLLKSADLAAPERDHDQRAIGVGRHVRQRRDLAARPKGRRPTDQSSPRGSSTASVIARQGATSWSPAGRLGGVPRQARRRMDAVVEGVKSPADIGWDAKRRRMLIPLFQDNAVEIRELR